MAVDMRECINKVKNQEKVNMFGKMEAIMLEDG
jgi:hypothetical protein